MELLERLKHWVLRIFSPRVGRLVFYSLMLESIGPHTTRIVLQEQQTEATTAALSELPSQLYPPAAQQIASAEGG